MKPGIVFVIANQKGGVGKTTTAIMLKDEFSKTLNLKTLVIDYDPQGSLTALLDIEKEEKNNYNKDGSICNLFNKEDVTILEYDTNTDIIISDSKLNNAFYSVKSGRELMLKKFLEKIKHDYDAIIIDTKPDLGGASLVSAILAADVIINPIATGGIEEDATVEFYEKLEETVDIYGNNIKKIFVIPTLVDQSRDSKSTLLSIKNYLPELYSKKYKTLSQSTQIEILKAVPRRAAIKNSTGVKVSVRQYIEEFDTGKKDVLLDIENMAKTIWKGGKNNG